MTYSIIDTRDISGETVSTHSTRAAAQREWDRLTQTQEYIGGRWERKERPSSRTLKIRNDATGNWVSDEDRLPPTGDRARLLQLISDGKYSQRGAARELGISERMMRYYCSGEQPTPRAILLALEHLVNCSPDQQ